MVRTLRCDVRARHSARIIWSRVVTIQSRCCMRATERPSKSAITKAFSYIKEAGLPSGVVEQILHRSAPDLFGVPRG
jgi:hypothetical protein